MSEPEIRWTGYLKYRAKLRGFDLAGIERILRYSTERYMDTATGRRVVVGHHNRDLVLIPYERQGDVVVPVTVHVTSRKQIRFRVKSGRFRNA
jgi:hypothetical protein